MTGDPLRLLDDPTTRAALRRDLGVARGSELGGYQVDAGLARFESRLASDLAHGTGPSGRSGAMGGGLAVGLAVGALLLAGGLVATFGWQFAGPTSPAPHAGWGDQEASPALTSAREAKRVTAPVMPRVDRPMAAVAAPQEEAEEVGTPQEDAERVAVRPPHARKSAVGREARAQGTGGKDADYLREAHALNAARSMLDRDPAQALKLARKGAVEFRAGTFVPEWDGVVVLALIELGRDGEARTRGEAYLQRHPSGTYAPRIRQAIGSRL